MEKLNQQSKESIYRAISRDRKLFNDEKYDKELPYLEIGLEMKNNEVLTCLCDIHLRKGNYQKAIE